MRPVIRQVPTYKRINCLWNVGRKGTMQYDEETLSAQAQSYQLKGKRFSGRVS
jgi:hypothetical protein